VNIVDGGDGTYFVAIFIKNKISIIPTKKNVIKFTSTRFNT
jgi:hypothetical protein